MTGELLFLFGFCAAMILCSTEEFTELNLSSAYSLSQNVIDLSDRSIKCLAACLHTKVCLVGLSWQGFNSGYYLKVKTVVEFFSAETH